MQHFLYLHNFTQLLAYLNEIGDEGRAVSDRWEFGNFHHSVNCVVMAARMKEVSLKTKKHNLLLGSLFVSDRAHGH